MRRQRVVDDDLPLQDEEEVEMKIPLPSYRAAVETVDGQRVVRISGIDDVKSVLYHEREYADVSHFAVVRVSLNEASAMVRHLVRMKITRQAMRISNAPALLQASSLGSAIIRLSEDLSQLHEGLRTNCIICELVDHIRIMPALPLDLQPAILRHGIDNLLDGIHATLAMFPAEEPAGRHAGPNTIPATPHGAEVYANLAAGVAAHLGTIDHLLANSVDYPNVPPASFVALDVDVKQLEELEENVYKRIRGLDHLRLLLSLPEQGMLTEFCVSQLYLGDADDILQALMNAMEPPKVYCFANFDRVKDACEIKNILLSISQSLQSIADGLRAGQIDRHNLESLEDLWRKLRRPVLGQCLTGAFRDAALALYASLLDLIDTPDVAMDAGEGDGAPPGLVAALTPRVESLLQQVGSIWGISIEYADESLPEVLQPKAVLDD